MTMVTFDTEDPLAAAAVAAIHGGDLPAPERLLAERPELATARLGDDDPDGMSRTLLHVVTDWPGHFPRGVETVRTLVGAGADVNARFRGPHAETPLHWAASTDDVDVLDALLADAATLGLMDRLEQLVADPQRPSADEISRAFWGACHGGQRRTAQYLLDRGADINWIPSWEPLTPLEAAARSGSHALVTWLHTHGAPRPPASSARSSALGTGADDHDARKPDEMPGEGAPTNAPQPYV